MLSAQWLVQTGDILQVLSLARIHSKWSKIISSREENAEQPQIKTALDNKITKCSPHSQWRLITRCLIDLEPHMLKAKCSDIMKSDVTMQIMSPRKQACHEVVSHFIELIGPTSFYSGLERHLDQPRKPMQNENYLFSVQ